MRSLLPASLLALIALWPPLAAAQSNNTSDEVELRVTLADGTELDGRVLFQRDRLVVRGARTRRIPYGQVASLGEVPPEGSDPAILQRQYERRLTQNDPEDARAWINLGRWTRQRGLLAESRQAYARAVALAPDDLQARRGLGQVRDEDGLDVDGDGWIDGAAAFAARRNAVAPGDVDGLVALARAALREDLDEVAFPLLQEALLADNLHSAALRLAKPFTDAYRQQVRMGMPIRGRWRASEDPTRHHQFKSYAVYALDLLKVDERGRHHSGSGRRLEDHHAFGAPFFAVADGIVVEVRDGLPDNPIGRIGDRAGKHNGVAIDHGDGEYSWYVHAKKGTILVAEGERVRRGQLLGEIGNSGGSAIPHLHFTLVAFRGISVPWSCEGYQVIAPDGVAIPVTRAWPREGWTVYVPDDPPPADPSADGDGPSEGAGEGAGEGGEGQGERGEGGPDGAAGGGRR